MSVAFHSGSPIWAFTYVPAHGGGAPRLGADGGLLVPASPAGDAYLVTGHDDGCLRKWDARMPGAPLSVLTGHAGAVTCLRGDGGGDKLVSGSVDATVRLWDVVSGLSLACAGHTAPVSSVAMGEDSIISSSWDGTVRCWYPST